jgi:hypothetical protein
LSTFHMPQNIFLMFYNQVKIENPLLWSRLDLAMIHSLSLQRAG